MVVEFGLFHISVAAAPVNMTALPDGAWNVPFRASTASLPAIGLVTSPHGLGVSQPDDPTDAPAHQWSTTPTNVPTQALGGAGMAFTAAPTASPSTFLPDGDDNTRAEERGQENDDTRAPSSPTANPRADESRKGAGHTKKASKKGKQTKVGKGTVQLRVSGGLKGKTKHAVKRGKESEADMDAITERTRQDSHLPGGVTDRQSPLDIDVAVTASVLESRSPTSGPKTKTRGARKLAKAAVHVAITVLFLVVVIFGALLVRGSSPTVGDSAEICTRPRYESYFADAAERRPTERSPLLPCKESDRPCALQGVKEEPLDLSTACS